MKEQKQLNPSVDAPHPPTVVFWQFCQYIQELMEIGLIDNLTPRFIVSYEGLGLHNMLFLMGIEHGLAAPRASTVTYHNATPQVPIPSPL